MSDFAPIFPGWNVWAIWQAKNLDFNPLMIGVSPERQLRVWVEDVIRLGAAGAIVADPIDLKGGQIKVLPGPPEKLTTAATKEQVSGPAMIINGPGVLHYVRFFNRGQKSQVVWPHDDNYLLEKVYSPNPQAPSTQGPPPPTIGSNVGEGVGNVATDVLSGSPWLVAGIVVVAGGILVWKLK